MNISYQWLRAIAPDITDTPDQLAARLAMAGAPADAVEYLDANLEDIIIAKVHTAGKHPNADRLSVCTVDAGTGEILNVVCGAPNVKAGAFYPFAPAGAKLPGGIEIKRAKIRGAESNGMLCSERELGLGRDHAGIMELRGDFTPGESFVPAIGLNDVRFVIDVGANRPDMLSHIGVARELAPGGMAALRLPEFPNAPSSNVAVASAQAEGTTGGLRVRIEDPDGCTRFTGAVIRGVTIAPSPIWLAARLRSIGLRPINNVVDATNYMLHELGQPMHAYDLTKLGGSEIVARRARAGESLVTLDGETRKLEAGMLIIADHDVPAGVAGVMGGLHSEVTNDTKDIFLECAVFDPKSVRTTRRALGLSTDASYRFERGVDWEEVRPAMQRAVSLIIAVAGGTADAPAIDVTTVERDAPVVTLRPARVKHVLGVQLSVDQIERYLTPLGFDVLARSADSLRVRVPGSRWHDVSREIDLIEEIARRHGFESFADDLRAFRPSAVPEDAMSMLENRLRLWLAGRGFLEARMAAFAPDSEGDVALLNPLSAAEGHLRNTVASGLLRRAEYNFARGTRNIRLFEIGTAFAAGDQGGLPVETNRLAGVFTGARTPPHWSAGTQVFDEWDLKGLIEDLSGIVGSDVSIRPMSDSAQQTAFPKLETGSSFEIVDPTGARVGVGGAVPANSIDAPLWAGQVYAFEIVLTDAMTRNESSKMRALPSFPGIERDMALLVDDSVASLTVENTIRGAAGPLLESLAVFDVYRGKGVPANMRSIAYRAAFRAEDRTLTDEDADRTMKQILTRLKEDLGVERRG